MCSEYLISTVSKQFSEKISENSTVIFHKAKSFNFIFTPNFVSSRLCAISVTVSWYFIRNLPFSLRGGGIIFHLPMYFCIILL